LGWVEALALATENLAAQVVHLPPQISVLLKQRFNPGGLFDHLLLKLLEFLLHAMYPIKKRDRLEEKSVVLDQLFYR
jgi:hypothetical protein